MQWQAWRVGFAYIHGQSLLCPITAVTGGLLANTQTNLLGVISPNSPRLSAYTGAAVARSFL